MNSAQPTVAVLGDAHAKRPQTRGARTRERLLGAAKDLFARSGYEGASIGDVAQRAGVGVGTVYHHFSDKRALLIALLEGDEGVGLGLDDGRGALGRALEADDVCIALHGLIRDAVEQRRRHPSVYPVGRELARRDPDVAACCARIEEAHRRRVREGVEHGQRIGRVRPDADPVAAAFILQQLGQETVSRIAEQPSDVEADAIVDEYAVLVCQYLLA